MNPDPAEEGDRSRVGRHRFWLRQQADFGSQHRFPACMVPIELVQYFRTALGVPAREIQLAAVRVIQAGLRQLYMMERAYASCAAHLLDRLGITTPSTLHTHRGMPVGTERCGVC